MGKHKKTIELLEIATRILAAHHPMTLRQVYYQLVSRQVIDNNRGQYQAVSNALVDARKDGTILWEWIEDRTRRPRTVSMWADLGEFAETVQNAYRRDVWQEQDELIEVWLEKDALSGIFEDVLRPYGVTLNVGRGYDGWSSIHDAAERYLAWGSDVTVLYFGDFDPSGEDMIRSLRERIGFFETCPEIVKVALVAEDIELYNLPPDFTKATDTRQAAFVARYGDVAVELDALPVDVLRDRLKSEIEDRMDLGAWAAVQRQEKIDKERITQALSTGWES